MTQHATGASSRVVSHEPVRAACSRVMHSLSETIVARGGAEAKSHAAHRNNRDEVATEKLAGDVNMSRIAIKFEKRR
jgi:hypothetical protein